MILIKNSRTGQRVYGEFQVGEKPGVMLFMTQEGKEIAKYDQTSGEFYPDKDWSILVQNVKLKGRPLGSEEKYRQVVALPVRLRAPLESAAGNRPSEWIVQAIEEKLAR
jgi:hypothetical protein